ncbi:MAG: hypothetical protein EP343_27010 [Deltaproteobacteria bacterium]|nr:MAG: hypothetical protein EP343_27010 [Deltaproteobacteria bacterium]
MRIVALSDTHTFESELPTPLPYGDVLVHAGDLLREGTLEELAPVAAWLQQQPHPHKIVVAGNHDVCFQTQEKEALKLLGPTVTYLKDSSLLLDGLQIWGSPWVPKFHDWAFMLNRGLPLQQKWKAIPSSVDILITHGPPAGIGDLMGPFGHAGCEDLAKEIQRIRPLLHLFGHSHACGGVYLKEGIGFANVTSWECERGPTVMDIDPHSKLVTFVEVPPGNLYPES